MMVADNFNNVKLQEGMAVTANEQRIVFGQDSELVHVPSTWQIQTLSESGYRITLTTGWPVLPFILPDTWVELKLHLLVTSQHDDVQRVTVTVNHGGMLNEDPRPILQPLRTGDPGYHLSSYIALLSGTLKDYLDKTKLIISWDVELHGTPTAQNFGQEVTAFVQAAFKQMKAMIDGG